MTQNICRRAHARILFDAPVQLMVKGELVERTLADLSEGGMRVNAKLPENTTFKIFLPVPVANAPRMPKRMCLFQGRAVWRSGEVTGIRFLTPPQDSTEPVRAFVASRE